MNEPLDAIHSDISIYDLELNLILSKKSPDLLSILQGSETYLVDSNRSWKQLAIDHPDKNFVLGRAYWNELEDIEGVFLKDLDMYPIQNAFCYHLYTDDVGSTSRIIRLDEGFPKDFNKNIPRLSELQSSEIEKFNDDEKRRNVCSHTLRAFNSHHKENLKLLIDHLKGKCRHNVANAIYMATLAHCLSIHRLSGTARKRELKNLEESTANIMNDSYMLQEALYLGFGIVTNDEKLKTMARISDVTLL